MFCDVPEVKVKIGQRFLLSLQEYVSITHGFPSSTALMWHPGTNAGQLHSMTCPSMVTSIFHGSSSEHGVDVVAQDQSWCTLHHFASYDGHPVRAQLLVNVAPTPQSRARTDGFHH